MTQTDQRRAPRRSTADGRFPLTDIQVAYLVGKTRLIELGGRQNYYIELDAVGLDPARAEEALNRLVARQEHLRTVICQEGDQRVIPAGETPRLRIPVADLTAVTEDQRHASLRQTRERMCEQGGLDPTGWPLFEVAISVIRRQRCRVHLRMNLILLDGPSLRHCLVEWLALYRNPDVPLPPVTRTFRDWRLELAEYERGEEFARQWRYWESRLDSLPEAPRLPLARQPGSIEKVSFTGRRSFLTGSQWRTLAANYRKHRILPTTGLLHVYAETLGCWAATPHFCLNVVHQNLATRHGASEEVVGQRSATLPLEIDLRDGGFWTRAQRLQRQLFRDMANSDVTAVRIGRELAIRGGWTQRAAFPYVFTSNQGPGWDTTISTRPAFRLLDRIQHTPQVLIDDQIRDAPDGGISSMLDFVEEAFPAGLPDLMVAAYRALLDAVSSPGGADAEPGPVLPSHRAQVDSINDTAEPLPAGRLEDGPLRQAAARPDAAAVVTSGRTLSYRELEASSRAVAGWLHRHGVGREDVVPVVMSKGVEQVVAVLGVLRAGAAYCPIDVATPQQRLADLLAESRARVVLSQSWHRIDTAGLPVLAADQLEPPAESAPSETAPAETAPSETAPAETALAVQAGPGDLAYIIYTSGSTGRPKGVMIEHRAALNTVLDINRRLQLGAGDRVFGISSLSFDLSVWDIFGTLAAGATLILPDAAPRPDPRHWAALAARQGATVWNSVPALAEMLTEVTGQRPELPRPPLRAVLLSGDWIPAALPGRMRACWPGLAITALGGATEASIWSNSFPVDRVDPAWRSIPYGGPLANQTMRVLDHRLELRQPWAVGEIYIGGAGLARGYWQDEQRTTERFVRHPRTGERLYRTGDLGRYWPDGTIEFLGRADRQVKIQGFRVEPGEVEAALLTHPQVRDCAVCADDGPGGQRRLLALVVPAAGARPAAQELTAHLSARLPRHLVPGHIHITGSLPVTANGKVDVARALATLPVPAAPPPDTADGPVVERLCRMWAELLEMRAVDPDDNFFALGGNSLLALRMVHRVRLELNVDLPLGQVFEAQTVRQFASCVQRPGRPPSGCAVELSGRPGTSLFLFHVVGGSIARYVPLAEAWPGPVRAFQSRALTDTAEDAFPPDLETMAAGYLAELRRYQPAGPYLLGGWSGGGLLAYEAARQLAAAGERPAIFMIDSELRDIHPPTGDLDRHLAFLIGLAQGPAPEAVVSAVRAAPGGRRAEAARDACAEHGLLPAEVDVAGYERLRRIQEHELALMAAYRPGPLAEPALLFLASDETGRPDPVPAWQAVCPGVTVQPVPGNHFTVADRFADLAGEVWRWLTRTSR